MSALIRGAHDHFLCQRGDRGSGVRPGTVETSTENEKASAAVQAPAASCLSLCHRHHMEPVAEPELRPTLPWPRCQRTLAAQTQLRGPLAAWPTVTDLFVAELEARQKRGSCEDGGGKYRHAFEGETGR